MQTMSLDTPENSPLLVPLAIPRGELLPLEYPFAWGTETLFAERIPTLLPREEFPTISFSAKRFSKILGYVPLIGTGVGIYRICAGFREYQIFKRNVVAAPEPIVANLRSRGKRWCLRGALELIPVFGGIVCLIADIAATILLKRQREDGE
jgi:hypothetical protein